MSGVWLIVFGVLLIGVVLFALGFNAPAAPPVSMPEITEAERAEAGENAMWTELGRVK